MDRTGKCKQGNIAEHVRQPPTCRAKAVTDTALMQVPFHDHLTHRGDGVFETLKCVNGAVYNLDAHLHRMQRSAHAIGLGFRKGFEAIRALILEALELAAQPMCSVRVVLSRGPGGMGVAPAESAGSA